MPAGDAAAHEHDHDHEADAAHVHEELGPHGGHLLTMGGDYQAEWLHDDASGLVTVYLLAKGTQAKDPVNAKTVALDVTMGGNTRHYDLQPGNGGESAAVQFSIKDRSLVEVLKAVGEGVEAALIAEIEGQTLRGEIQHLDHDHEHTH